MNKSLFGLPYDPTYAPANNGTLSLGAQTRAISLSTNPDYGRFSNSVTVEVTVLQYNGATHVEFPCVATYKGSRFSIRIPTTQDPTGTLTSDNLFYGLTKGGEWVPLTVNEFHTGSNLVSILDTTAPYYTGDTGLDISGDLDADLTKYTKIRVKVYNGNTAITLDPTECPVLYEREERLRDYVADSAVVPYLQQIADMAWGFWTQIRPSGQSGTRSSQRFYGFNTYPVNVPQVYWRNTGNFGTTGTNLVTSTPVYGVNNNQVYNVAPEIVNGKLAMNTTGIVAVIYNLDEITFTAANTRVWTLSQYLSASLKPMRNGRKTDPDGLNYEATDTTVIPLKNENGVAVGSYVGNGSNVTLNIPFKPAAIALCPLRTSGNAGGMLYIANADSHKLHAVTSCQYISIELVLNLSSMNGTTVVLDNNIHHTENGITYYYVAWR